MINLINYSKFLFESLRAYFAVNASGLLSLLYRYLLSCLYPLQTRFDSYAQWRNTFYLISNCKWQTGQLTNVLNRLFDPINESIYITLLGLSSLQASVYGEVTNAFATVYDEIPAAISPVYGEGLTQYLVVIHVPTNVFLNLSNITSVVEQIKISGVNYTFVEII